MKNERNCSRPSLFLGSMIFGNYDNNTKYIKNTYSTLPLRFHQLYFLSIFSTVHEKNIKWKLCAIVRNYLFVIWSVTKKGTSNVLFWFLFNANFNKQAPSTFTFVLLAARKFSFSFNTTIDWRFYPDWFYYVFTVLTSYLFLWYHFKIWKHFILFNVF